MPCGLIGLIVVGRLEVVTGTKLIVNFFVEKRFSTKDIVHEDIARAAKYFDCITDIVNKAGKNMAVKGGIIVRF